MSGETRTATRMLLGPPTGNRSVPFAERMHRYITPEPNTGCWLWAGMVNVGGYGRVQVGDRYLAAHRVVYETLRGAIPPGLQLDHLCRVRCCVNPDHLEPVTQRENMLRGESPKLVLCRTNTCKNGHALTEDNVVRYGDDKRRCKTCKVARDGKRWKAIAAAARVRALKTP